MNIKGILEKHQKWLNGEAGGERANLRGADLRGADLRGAERVFPTPGRKWGNR